MELREFIKLYIEKKWNPSIAHTAKWFSNTYGFSEYVIRHHLNHFVFTNELISVKIKGRVYYMLVTHKSRFLKYKNVKGVKIVTNIQTK